LNCFPFHLSHLRSFDCNSSSPSSASNEVHTQVDTMVRLAAFKMTKSASASTHSPLNSKSAPPELPLPFLLSGRTRMNSAFSFRSSGLTVRRLTLSYLEVRFL
jgi:hypothetical protein